MPPTQAPLQILYEDNHCLAVVKPAGWLVAGDETGDLSLLDVAKAHIKQQYSKPGDVYLGLIHRIDRPVSGVVLFARTSKAAGRLAEQFRSGSIRKVYRAIVEGLPPVAEGQLHDWLRKDETRNVSEVVQASAPGARECRLNFRVLISDRSQQQSMLEIVPRTGRSHQIRVQLSHQGWPILGDRKYGAKHPFPEAIALHAFELTFEHPTRKEPVTLRAELPAQWPKFERA